MKLMAFCAQRSVSQWYIDQSGSSEMIGEEFEEMWTQMYEDDTRGFDEGGEEAFGEQKTEEQTGVIEEPSASGT